MVLLRHRRLSYVQILAGARRVGLPFLSVIPVKAGIQGWKRAETSTFAEVTAREEGTGQSQPRPLFSNPRLLPSDVYRE